MFEMINFLFVPYFRLYGKFFRCELALGKTRAEMNRPRSLEPMSVGSSPLREKVESENLNVTIHSIN